MQTKKSASRSKSKSRSRSKSGKSKKSGKSPARFIKWEPGPKMNAGTSTTQLEHQNAAKFSVKGQKDNNSRAQSAKYSVNSKKRS